MPRHITSLAVTVLTVAGLAGLTGCAQTSSGTAAGGAPPSSTAAGTPDVPAGTRPPTASTTSQLPGDLGGCPSPSAMPSGMQAAVDYVDFVGANGYLYSGGRDKQLTDSDRGPVQLRVRCTASTWSDRYGQALDTGDGYAGFLPVGTSVYAVNGASPLCQLMARSDDGWHRYKAASPPCHDSEPPAATALPPQQPHDASLADCPRLTPSKDGAGAAVDYGDFVQSHAVAYIVDDRLTVTAADKGARQLTVRCALGHLNEVTHLQPPDPRDGDSSFLPAGTAVFAVHGFATRCRLMAVEQGQWVAYTPRPTPAGCPEIAPNG